MKELAADGLVVAVLTYRRPADIALALPRLIEQVKSVGDGARVLVIDNDPAASARELVEGLDSVVVSYAHEATAGIAAARNRALSESVSDRLLVFIDDDETPSADWLASLLGTYEASGAAAVVGPVVSQYAEQPEPWISEGQFFRRRRLPTGTALTVAATNNLLLDLEQIRRLNLSFDERFGLSGGSDTLFTRSLVQLGGRMVWCDEAVVYDQVPESRLSKDWVLRRALRSGNSAVRVDVELSTGLSGKIRARSSGLARGSVRMAAGVIKLGAGSVAGSLALRAQGSRTVARGAGMASAAFGYVYSEYRRS